MSQNPEIENPEFDKENTHKFKCEQCFKTYKYRSHLKDHQKIVHLRLRYPCPICKQEFVTPRNVRRHAKSAHSQSIGKIDDISSRTDQEMDLQLNEEQLQKLDLEFSEEEPVSKKAKPVVIRFMKEEYYYESEYWIGELAA